MISHFDGSNNIFADCSFNLCDWILFIQKPDLQVSIQSITAGNIKLFVKIMLYFILDLQD